MLRQCVDFAPALTDGGGGASGETFKFSSILSNASPAVVAGGCASQPAANKDTATESRLAAGVAVDGEYATFAVKVNVQLATATIGPALESRGDGRFDVVYSTITDRTDLPTSLIACAMTGTFVVRNSALLDTSEPETLDCKGDITVTRSAVTSTVLEGKDADNVLLAPADAPSLFVDWTAGDLDLMPPATPLLDVALRLAGDPTTDIDGIERPPVDSADVAGADRP